MLRVIGHQCCVRLHGAKSLTGFKLCATTCSRVTSNNVKSCSPTMLPLFARGLKEVESLVLTGIISLSKKHIFGAYEKTQPMWPEKRVFVPNSLLYCYFYWSLELVHFYLLILKLQRASQACNFLMLVSVVSTGLINGTYQYLRVNNRPLPLPRGDDWTSLNRPWWGYWMLFYTILYVFTTSSSHEIFLISFCRL